MNLISTIFRKQPVERDEDHIRRDLNNDIGNLRKSLNQLDEAYEAFMNDKGVIAVAKDTIRYRRKDRED